MMKAEEATTTVTLLGEETWDSYDRRSIPIGKLSFKPGQPYGPFFRVDGPHWNPSAASKEGRWAGLARPSSRAAAEKWYAPDKRNPKSHVYEFFVEIPKGITKAVGFLGKVKKGTGFQVKLNNVAIAHVRRVKKRHLS